MEFCKNCAVPIHEVNRMGRSYWQHNKVKRLKPCKNAEAPEKFFYPKSKTLLIKH